MARVVAAGSSARRRVVGGGGGITLAQPVKYMETNAYGTVHTWTPDSTVPVGSTVLVFFTLFDSTLPIVSIQTNTSTALTLVSAQPTSGSDNLYCYSLVNAGAGVTSIVLTLTAANLGHMTGAILTGVDTADLIEDVDYIENGYLETPHPSPTLTTAAAGAAVFAFYYTNTRTSDAPSSGYTVVPAATSGTIFLVYDLDVGAAGSHSPTLAFTTGTSTYVLSVAVNKAPA